MKKNKVLSITILLLLVLSSNVFAEINIGENIVRSYLVGDYETGKILEGHNVDIPVEIASVTKIMTYLIVMEEIDKGNISLEDKVSISRESARIGGSSLKLKTDEVLTVEELLKGILIVSANDGTHALALHTYGSEEEFVNQMNKKAEELNLKTAKFYNASGLPKGDVQNKMSPREIFELTRYIIKKYPESIDITSQRKLIIEDRDFEQSNTNDLLYNTVGVDGFKTGYTDKAGYCLVSTRKSNEINKDCRLIAVVMGAESSKNRTMVSKKIYSHVMNTYKNKNLLYRDRPLEIVKMPNTKDGYIKLYPEKNYSEIIRSNEILDMDIKIDQDLKAPFSKGEKVGNVDIYRNGELIDSIKLEIRENIDRVQFLDGILSRIKLFFSSIFKINLAGAN